MGTEAGRISRSLALSVGPPNLNAHGPEDHHQVGNEIRHQEAR